MKSKTFCLDGPAGQIEFTIDRFNDSPTHQSNLFDLYRVDLPAHYLSNGSSNSTAAALKVPRVELTQTELHDALHRLGTEVKIYQMLENRLNSSSYRYWPFARHLATGSDDPTALLIEWLDNHSTLANSPSQFTTELLRNCQQLFQAVAIVHTLDKGAVTHRDIRPANILLGPEGIKLVDFGHARIGQSKHTETMNGDRAVIGASDWPHAPEIRRQRQQGQPADVWSTAQSIIYALASQPAKQGSTTPDGLTKIGVPPHIAMVLSTALREVPNRRSHAPDILRQLDSHKSEQNQRTSFSPPTSGESGIDFVDLIDAGAALESMLEKHSITFAPTAVRPHDSRPRPLDPIEPSPQPASDPLTQVWKANAPIVIAVASAILLLWLVVVIQRL